ncbi:MAG: glycosyltransferase family 2 protein [Elusimicrobia bacterium]|nr:glycosyltransferase family 2 protein [Elusimicrobiota bacterium]
MTLTHLFLAAAYACSAYLMGFALVYAATATAFLFLVGKERRRFEGGGAEPVAALVPALNEGPGLVGCALSLLDQDHTGPVSARILIKDGEDTSVPHLLAAFPDAGPEVGGRRTLSSASGRKLELVFTGLTSKADKLNSELPHVKEAFVAFLDADHLAHHSWLRSSLAILNETGAAAVQARRWPLSAAGIYRLWDSLQHHVGNQVLNFVYRRLGVPAQFTGTTALFRREVLERYPFGHTLTEDTDLFYRLLQDGEKVAYNPFYGSSEDLSPDLHSFVARRRRWSHGHTRAFFAHLRPILASEKTGRRVKAQFIVHGQFYLATLAIAALHLLLGSYFFLQMPPSRQLAIALAGALVSGLLSSRQSGAPWSARGFDFVVGWLWSAPVAALAAALAMRWSGDVAFLYMIPFPHEKTFAALCAAGIGAPLAMLGAGALRLHVMSGWHLLAGAVSFPVILFLDIYGGLLGLSDWLSGMKLWKAVRRSGTAALDGGAAAFTGKPAALRFPVRPASVVWVALLLMMPPLLAHDYAYYQTCGKGGPLRERPFFDLRSSPLEFYTWTEKRREGKDDVRVILTAEVIQTKPERELAVEFWLGGALVSSTTLLEDYRIVSTHLRFPLGWESKELRARITGKGFRCESVEKFSTDFKEVSGRNLLVNGEPFLVKGMVPSFSHPTLGVDLGQGYRLIKDLGANAIRLYHSPNDALRKEAAAAQLLVIDQAEASTWDDMDLSDRGDRNGLRRRFHKLKKQNHGFAYALIHNLGNELDLALPDAKWKEPLKELTRGLGSADGGEVPASYASHRLDVDFQTAVRSVNMLDTGRHYWEKGLPTALSRRVPFLAGEFGGFLGAAEVVPSWYRTARFVDQWRMLLAGGAVGGVFFESHDNWAQPQFKRVTDPFSADTPDDKRGVWDRYGEAGLEAERLRDIYSDVELTRKDGSTTFTNRRPYWLRAVTMTGWGSAPTDLGDLAPHGKKTLKGLPKEALIRLDYTTHRGLAAVSWARFAAPPISKNYSLTGLQASVAGSDWGPFAPAALADGEVRLRFMLTEINPEALLILAGLRSRRVELSHAPTGSTVRTLDIPEDLPYQEQLLPLKDLAPGPYILTFRRDLRRSIFDKDIALEEPVIVAPRS